MHDTLINSGNIDYDNVAALQQKRTLAFINHFVLTTVQFLNSFSKQCEQKLMHFENKLEKINASLVLLETRLSSLPDVIDPEIITKEPIETENTPIQVESITDIEENKEPVKLEYMRFVKMVQVGVPLQAVKLKMSTEGLDPNELDKMLKV